LIAITALPAYVGAIAPAPVVRRVIALLLIAAVAACKVDSIEPITPADESRPDPALYGVWQHREKDEIVYVHIGPEFSLSVDKPTRDTPRRMRIVLVEHKSNGLTDEEFVAHASRVGATRYLNVVQTERGKPVGFILVRYALADRQTLRFATINEERLKEAIRAGRIAGAARGGGLSSETSITAGSPELAAFLASEGDALFGKPIVLRRMPSR
jgi:hypothetical protein